MYKILLAFFLTFGLLSAEQTKNYSTKPKVPYSVEEAEKVRSEAIQNLKLAELARESLMDGRDNKNLTIKDERSSEKKSMTQKVAAKETKASQKTEKKQNILTSPKKLQPLRANKCACAHSQIKSNQMKKRTTYPKKLLYVK